MKKHGLIPMITVSALTLVTGAASMTGSAAAQTSTPSFCSGTSAIPVSNLASPISLANCPLQGRLVVRSDGDGRNIGVHVPPPGHTEAIDATTTSGDYVLAVTNKGGQVTAATSFPTMQAQRLPNAAVAADTDPACTELAVAYLGFVWNKTLDWYYNTSTISRTDLNAADALAAIRGGNSNITNGVNNCGWSEAGFGSFLSGSPPLGAYQGSTSLYANIDSAAECTSKFPDGQNTVSWGPFDSSEAGTLGVTCWDYDTGGDNFAVEADIYLGSNADLVTSFPEDCTDSYDLETTATHEWGHAYGLDHETTDPDEVMYPYQSACVLRRHLGEGDYAGMANLYGVK